MYVKEVLYIQVVTADQKTGRKWCDSSICLG